MLSSLTSPRLSTPVCCSAFLNLACGAFSGTVYPWIAFSSRLFLYLKLNINSPLYRNPRPSHRFSWGVKGLGWEYILRGGLGIFGCGETSRGGMILGVAISFVFSLVTFLCCSLVTLAWQLAHRVTVWLGEFTLSGWCSSSFLGSISPHCSPNLLGSFSLTKLAIVRDDAPLFLWISS